jgi:hypothetical protein
MHAQLKQDRPKDDCLPMVKIHRYLKPRASPK